MSRAGAFVGYLCRLTVSSVCYRVTSILVSSITYGAMRSGISQLWLVGKSDLSNFVRSLYLHYHYNYATVAGVRTYVFP